MDSIEDELSIFPGCITDSALELAKLINLVYAVAEEGMWKQINGGPAPRTSEEEVHSLLAADRILIAKRGNLIIGSVCVRRLSPSLAEFGMLVAHPDCRGIGLGKALLNAAENYGRAGGAEIMQLELLTPKTWEHPVKAFLHQWYTRIGYKPMKQEPFEKTYAALAEQLAAPCNFTIYHKKL